MGSFDHYTGAVDTIKRLKRERCHDEAESLLLWCIERTEQEGFDDPVPWYYKHLAIVYRKENRYDEEVRIIKRSLNNAPAPRDDLQKRLDRERNSQRTRISRPCRPASAIVGWGDSQLDTDLDERAVLADLFSLRLDIFTSSECFCTPLGRRAARS